MIVELKTKVLIVEDDKSWQELYAEMLGPEGEGYEIVQVNNYQDAITQLDEQQFALAIVDLNLPKSLQEPEPGFEHGTAVIDHISNKTPKPNILVSTGHDKLPLDVGRMLGQLGIDVTTKFGDADDLLEKVRQQVQVHPTDIVMKFGGTSMGSSTSINTVANIVTDHVQQTAVPCIVVVSAMSKITNDLLVCARQALDGNHVLVQEKLDALHTRHTETATALVANVGLLQEYLTYLDKARDILLQMYQGVAALEELSLRARDRISGYGERLSARLLAATLESRGVKSVSVDAIDVIVTDDVFGSASPLLDETAEKAREILVPHLERGVVPVVTGFISATSDGIPTTLGRGGSDYSATILGAALNAREVWIWTDVTGIMDADPNLVPDAEIIEQISYERAAELTYHGAKVLHPKALSPIISKRIPVRILNTFAPKERGTLIGPGEAVSNKGGSLVSSPGLGLVTISSDLDQSWTPTVGARALTVLARDDIEVMGYFQSFSRRTLSITICEADTARTVSILSREFKSADVRNLAQHITARGQIATVSIVGKQQISPTAFIGHILSNLTSAGIKILGVIQVPTENSVSILVDQGVLKDAVLIAHDAMADIRRTE